MGVEDGGGYEMKDNYSLLRATSCVGDPSSTALQSLRSRDLRTFTDILNTEEDVGSESSSLPEEHWINTPIQEENGETLLTSAISNHLHHFVQVLLAAGAQANLYNQQLANYPIHVAARVGERKCIELLLNSGCKTNRGDVNAVNKVGRTALHVAVERNDVDLVDYLLQVPGVLVNPRDKKGGQTPLYLAVKNKSPQLVEMLLEQGANLQDICFGKCIQDLISEQMPDLDITRVKLNRAPLERETSSNTTQILLGLVDKAGAQSKPNQADLQTFKSLLLQFDTKTLGSIKTGGISLLQKCCVNGLDEFVEALLEEGLDPNYCPPESYSAPVLLAGGRGHLQVLQVLRKYNADFSVLKKQTDETILHRVLIKEEHFEIGDYQGCLDLLLSVNDPDLKDQIDQIINKKDIFGNTALHYATQKWDQSIVRSLLERGANIGIKNRWGEIPIQKIDPETMEAFLNEYCLQSTNDVNHEDFELVFKYNFLAPPLENLPTDVLGPYSDDEENHKISDRDIQKRYVLPETESLWYMGQTKEHRHLLKHPVITSFLWCKWNRIRRYFNRNLRFYLLFVTILTWYVFETFGGDSLRSEDGGIKGWYYLFSVFSAAMLIFIIKDWISDVKDLVYQESILEGSVRIAGSKSYWSLIFSNWLEVVYLTGLAVILWLGPTCLYSVLLVLLCGLALRELFQLAVSIRRYILDLENWIEVGMIICISIVLLRPDVVQPAPGETNNGTSSVQYSENQFEQERDLKRHLAALSLLFSWSELITFIAKHPRLNIYNVYVTMFYKVLSTFFFFLLWYIFFILAFALSFYIMLHRDFETSPESEYVFFDSPWLSLVKTSTMFVGELEFSDIPVNLDSKMAPLSYLFFLSFVFLIVVVLMNLLNGLAVSDTGAIQEHSEIVSYLSRVDTISYAESLLLGDPFDFFSSWPRLRLRIPSLSFCRQFYRHRTIRRFIQRLTGATNVLLFYNFLPDKMLSIKPNRRGNTCSERETIPRDIIDSARRIIISKMNEAKESDLEKKMTRIEAKLDLLLSRSNI